MNTDKLVPIDFSRKITPVVIGDFISPDGVEAHELFTDSVVDLVNSGRYDNDFIVSYADRTNTGKQPVDDDVRVDADFDDSLYYNANASEVTWSEDDEASTSHETWKPNHDAMVERYQASLTKEWPTKEQQENINPGIKPELSAIEMLKSFGYKHENGVWSQQEVKPELAAYMNPHVKEGGSRDKFHKGMRDCLEDISKMIGLSFCITVGYGNLADELRDYMDNIKHDAGIKAGIKDSSIERLGVFLRKNELVFEGEGVIDCVIRELAEKHDIDTRTNEEKLRDAMTGITVAPFGDEFVATAIGKLMASDRLEITLKGK